MKKLLSLALGLTFFVPFVTSAACSPVALGGTGRCSFQANALIYGNGTSPLATTSAGINGQFLSLVGGVPTWATVSSSGSGVATTSLLAAYPLKVTATSASITYSLLDMATTTVSCSGTVSCSPFVVIGGTPITITGSGGSTGLSTTSPLANSNLLVYSTAGAGSAYGVATSTLSATSPLTGSVIQVGSGGALGCQTASGSQAGCLSSTDWTTFNNKGSGTVTSVTATYPLSSTNGTTPVISSATSSGSSAGVLSAADWTTFNGKQAALSFPLTYAQGGTGTSTAASYGNLLMWNGSHYEGMATSSLGISASPGGSDTQVQFNDGGSFGGDFGLLWDKTSKKLSVGDGIATTTITKNIIKATYTGTPFLQFSNNQINYGFNDGGAQLILGNGTTPDVFSIYSSGVSYATILDTSALTVNRTFSFMDLSGFGALGSYSTGFTNGYIPFGAYGLLATSTGFTYSTTTQSLAVKNASTTALSVNGNEVSGQRYVSFRLATSTAWTASSSASSVYGDVALIPAPFTGSFSSIICKTNAGTLTVQGTANSNNAYLVASTTANTNAFALSFTKGDLLTFIGGNPATSPTSVPCTAIGSGY